MAIIFLSVAFILRHARGMPVMVLIGILMVAGSYLLQSYTFGSFTSGSDSARYLDYIYSEDGQITKDKFENFGVVYSALTWPFLNKAYSAVFFGIATFLVWMSIYFYLSERGLLFREDVFVFFFFLVALWMSCHVYRDGLIGAGILSSGLLLTNPRKLWVAWFLFLMGISIFLRPELSLIYILSAFFALMISLWIRGSYSVFFLVGLLSAILAFSFMYLDVVDWQRILRRLLVTKNIGEVTAFNSSYAFSDNTSWIKEIVVRFFSRAHTIILSDNPGVIIYNNIYGAVYRNTLLMAIYFLISVFSIFWAWPRIFCSIKSLAESRFNLYAGCFFFVFVFVNIIKWSGVQTRLFLPVFTLLIIASLGRRLNFNSYMFWGSFFGGLSCLYLSLWALRAL